MIFIVSTCCILSVICSSRILLPSVVLVFFTSLELIVPAVLPGSRHSGLEGKCVVKATDELQNASVPFLCTFYLLIYLVKRERGKQAVGRTQNRSNIRRESSWRRDEWREATKEGSDSCKSGRGKDSDSVFTGVKRETAKLKGWSKVFLVVPLFAVSSEAHLTWTPARVVDTVDLEQRAKEWLSHQAPVEYRRERRLIGEKGSDHEKNGE